MNFAQLVEFGCFLCYTPHLLGLSATSLSKRPQMRFCGKCRLLFGQLWLSSLLSDESVRCVI